MQSTAKQQCLYLLTETSGVLIDGTLKSSIRLKKQNRFVSVRYFYYRHFALLVNKKNSLPPKWRHIYCIGMYPVRAAVGVEEDHYITFQRITTNGHFHNLHKYTLWFHHVTNTLSTWQASKAICHIFLSNL